MVKINLKKRIKKIKLIKKLENKLIKINKDLRINELKKVDLIINFNSNNTKEQNLKILKEKELLNEKELKRKEENIKNRITKILKIKRE